MRRPPAHDSSPARRTGVRRLSRHFTAWGRCLGTLGVAVAACSDGQPPPAAKDDVVVARGGCTTAADCGADELCLHGQCVAGPTDSGDTGSPAEAVLSATPGTLNFGRVDADETRRLAVVLSNTSDTMVVLQEVRIDPAQGAPPASAERYQIESLGVGPFWIRPGRSRDVFVTYTGDGGGPHIAELWLSSNAPNVRVSLAGN